MNPPSRSKSVDQFGLMFVDAGVGMVVSPVEPVVFQRWDAVETLSLHRAGDGAALEIPLAGSSGIEQGPFLFIGWGCRRITGWSIGCDFRLKKEFSVATIDAADEDAE